MNNFIRGAGFDSRLDVAGVGPNHHANLTLTVRIAMHEYFPGNSSFLDDLFGISGGRASLDGQEVAFEREDGSEIVLTTWPRGEFAPWCADYECVVQDGWNNKIWLVPSGPWAGAIPDPTGSGLTLVPAVRCCLNIELVTSGEHVHCDVAHLALSHAAGGFRTSTAPVPDAAGRLQRVLQRMDCFPPGSGGRLKADNLDLTPKRGTNQIAALHEMGHYLGLHHVNHGGPGDPYGTDAGQRKSLMGAGTEIRSAHGWPWLNRLRQHSLTVSSGRWGAVTVRPRLQLMRIAPNRTRQSPDGDDHGVQMLDGGVAATGGVSGPRGAGPVGLLA